MYGNGGVEFKVRANGLLNSTCKSVKKAKLYTSLEWQALCVEKPVCVHRVRVSFIRPHKLNHLFLRSARFDFLTPLGSFYLTLATLYGKDGQV